MKRDKKRRHAELLSNDFVNTPFADLNLDLPTADESDDDTNNESDGSDESIFGGAEARLTVRLEKKGRRGKQVTVVEGFAAEAELADVVGELRRALATGGTVDGDHIVLQGDLRTRVTTWLESQGQCVRCLP